MRKNRLFVLGIITMFVAILSLTLVSGTMARYTSTVSGDDSARVAKWKFTLNDGSTSEDVTADDQYTSFDLFNTIIDTKDGNPEDDVHTDLIAPGTKGSFQIIITNGSEVNAEFSINFTSELKINGSADETYLPIIFTLKVWNGADYDVVGAADKLSSLAVNGEDIQMNGGEAKYLVEWEWVFNGDNGKDTNLGVLAQGGNVFYNTTITVKFDQVD